MRASLLRSPCSPAQGVTSEVPTSSVGAFRHKWKRAFPAGLPPDFILCMKAVSAGEGRTILGWPSRACGQGFLVKPDNQFASARQRASKLLRVLGALPCPVKGYQ